MSHLRCPTCKNPLPPHSVFQCGGCGSLLTAPRIDTKVMVGAVFSNSNNRLSGDSEIDVVGGQGFVRSLSLGFNEVGKGRNVEINCDAVIGGNGSSCFEDKEKMRDSRIDGLVMLTSSNSLDEGPSNSEYVHNPDRTSHVGAGMRNIYFKGSKRVEHLERERLELLRKLEDLNDQLGWSGSIFDTTEAKGVIGRDMAHNEPYGIADAWIPNERAGMSKTTKQKKLEDNKLGRPPYYTDYPDTYPDTHTNRHGSCSQSLYHHPHNHDDTLRYGMSFGPQMPRRPATSVSSQYSHHPNFHLYYPGQYVDADPDSFKPYQHNALSHHPACSCLQCYNIHQNSFPSVPRSNFLDGTYLDMPRKPMVYNYDSRVTGGSSSLHDTTTCMRGAGDFNSRVGYDKSLPTRRVIQCKSGRQCLPLLGGAPFITCPNCFELLQLPIKLRKSEDAEQKLQCGACSTSIHYFFRNNKLLISEDREWKNESEASEVMDQGIYKIPGPVNQNDAKFNSDDFDSLGNDFKLPDEQHTLRDTCQNVKNNKTRETNFISINSSFPSSTDEEHSQFNLSARRNLQNSIPPPPGSPLHEHFEPSSNNYIINQDGKENLGRRSDHEKVNPKAVVNTGQNSLKEVSMATEIEVSFNGCSNSGISQDSGNEPEDQHPQVNRKDGFAGIIKKSFKEIIKLDQGNVGDKSCVTINGHLISDQTIKKASRRAGRIRPGNYWYDIRAGFWGVMGGPCLGIIPPFVEELNYPLAEDCSGGMTGVFVNGRELHESDLQLLSGRGLPTTRNRSYIIEISGWVLDSDTGKELVSLGRLAKTVEKAKHGFGMKVPKQTCVNKIE